MGYAFHDLAGYLTDKNYHLLISEWYPIVEYGVEHKWRQFDLYPCELFNKEAYGNIIAVKDSKMFNDLLSASEKYEKHSLKTP